MRIQEHISLKELTTLKIGGVARYFVLAQSISELKEAIAFAKEKEVPFMILGGGSNILIHDSGFQGLVIKNEFKGIEYPSHRTETEQERGTDTKLIIAGAGESWDELVATTVERELWGLENLSGIPGSVGATPVQNIGAYGAEIKDTLEWVEVFDAESGEVQRIANADCEFEYRDSIFKNPENKCLIITSVAFRLKTNGTPNLEYKDLKERFKIQDSRFKKEWPALADIRKAVLEIRSKKFPDLTQFGTAGSFFKNPIISQEQFDKLKKQYPDLHGFSLSYSPLRKGALPSSAGGMLASSNQKLMVKLPLAWILDNICNLKGYRKGNVALFEKQPIVLVNLGDATADEIKEFAEEIIACVKSKTGIDIEPEVQYMS